MALAGDGALALWFDVAPEQMDEFFEWHNREHMPERLGNAGFRCGRRFGAIKATRQFFVLYETRSPDTISGPEYLNCVRFRSEWSGRMVLLNNSRAIFRVLFSLGSGQGGSMLTLRFPVATGREEDVRRLLAHDLLPKLVDEPGIAGCHLLRIDKRAMDATAGQSPPFRVMPGQEIGPEWAVLVEGSRDAAALEKAAGALLTDAALTRAGAEGPVQRSLYDLQYGLFRIAA